MSKGCFKDLKDRGFFYQHTDEENTEKNLDNEKVTFYIGFDPTANSLHVGHLLPIMAARRLQQAGHNPIMLVGGATALIGDPSGKQEARPIMSRELVAENAESLRLQIGRFIDLEDSNAKFANNADWLSSITYLDMLRDIGTHFSVNRMLAMDSVKSRLEAGLSFLEFNYSILQAYDFLTLNRKHGCTLQVGGQDQWGNIVSGVELTRRVAGNQVFGATFPLLMDSSGQKFGKSAGGAVWLDPDKTSIFEYYQFWRNANDADVKNLLCLFTSIPLEEINELCKLEAPAINRAKEILAFEATKLAHGKEEATKAFLAAGTKFGFSDPERKINTSSEIITITTSDGSDNLPTYEIKKSDLNDGIWIVELLSQAGLCSSNGEARRLIKGGGAYFNNVRISDMNFNVNDNDLANGEGILKAGKKKIRRLIIVD